MRRYLLSGGIETIAGRRHTAFCAETTIRLFGASVGEFFRYGRWRRHPASAALAARVGKSAKDEAAGSGRGLSMGKVGCCAEPLPHENWPGVIDLSGPNER